MNRYGIGTWRVYSSGDETGVFQEDQVKSPDADALAPCVTRTSTAMALMMQSKQILVFHKKTRQIWGIS